MKRILFSIYTQGTLEESDSELDSFSIQNNFPNSAQIRLSVDRPVDRPKSRSTVPVDRSQPRVSPCQSVDRAVDRLLLRSAGRSTAMACACWCTPVDRFAAAVSSLPWLPRRRLPRLPLSSYIVGIWVEQIVPHRLDVRMVLDI